MFIRELGTLMNFSVLNVTMSQQIIIINLQTVTYVMTIKLALNVIITISWIVKMMDVLWIVLMKIL